MRGVLGALACLFAVSGAAAENASDARYALIVGASAYTAVSTLNGPRNDVTLIVNTLLEAGVPRTHIRVLADGLERAQYDNQVVADGDATYDEILAGLDWLAGVASASTQTLVFFSGHGTQFPVEPSRTEPDGFDEVFLPVDIAVTNAPGVYLERALRDDELEPKFQAITVRGAHLWFISDSCHSGTLSRAGDVGRVARFVDPTSIGVPRALVEQARVKAASRRWDVRANADAPSGRFVGFYAAQADQVTYEEPIGGLDGLGAPRVHGEFTWSIARGLKKGAFRDYESLAQYVLADHLQGGHGDVMPMFEGALSATPMIGAGDVQTFALGIGGEKPFLRAGRVNGVEAGTVLDIFDGHRDGVTVAQARVSSAGVATAQLVLSSEQDLDRVLRAAKDGEMDAMARYRAKIVERPVSFVTRVARPIAYGELGAALADRESAQRIASALEDVAKRSASTQPLAFELVGAAQPADIYPVVASGRVWFFRRGDALALSGIARPLSLGADASAEAVFGALRLMAKATNLLRVVAASEAGAALKIETFVRRSGVVGADEACATPVRGEIAAVPADAVATPALPLKVHHCDAVILRLTNLSAATADVTPFYLDQWSQIRLVKPYQGWQRGALQIRARETRVLGYTENLSGAGSAEGRPLGLMQIVVLVTPGEEGAPRDYSYLESVMDKTRLGEEGFGGLLARAGFGDGTARGDSATSRENSGGGFVIPVETSVRAP